MSDKTIQNTTVGTVQPGALTAIARKEDFLQHLQDFLDTHKTEKWCVAAIDVEHFRLYNELYGTEQGNTLLNTLASHLLDYQKTSGCPVGYWGNDDFFLCLPDDRVQQQDIVITLQTCVSPNHQDVTFFLALGLCPVSEHPEADAATLCNYAQIAVMNPDHSGSGIHRFAPAMLDSLKAQQQLLSELEHALDNHEFTFFLQPKCNSMTRAIVGMEALVRWNHPTRGCVQPSEFMPLLESTGLISRLDQYIWEAVCQTLQKWQASGSNLVPVSVNVSVVDIVNLDVPQIFSDLVEKYQLEPKLLLAEITETMLAENSSVVENAIQGLHRKGFSVMMDDFGSGYSSLNMLKDTNVDAIKLDMKLIDMNQQNHSKGVQIVESVINMAHRLNLPIIAEGVETPEQVSMLQAADCLYTQGYYFFKPMPIENAEKLLAQPNNADYWDIRRDLMRRDHRTAAEDPDSEKTALALQAYQIFTDNLLEVSLLNLVTGTYRVIKRDARLPGADLAKEEDFTTFCDRLVNEKVVHPDDAEMFQEQVDLPLLQDTLFHTQQPEFYRFRQQVASQFVWITMEVLPCRGCCAQSPWATVLMREDAQANQLSEELDFSYSHDTLTGLANRSKYESDLRELQYSDYDSMVCTYIDVVGLHEVNDHLGHRSGDNLLCTIANAARKFFVSSRIYRVGGDEFVVLTPNLPPYDVWTASDRMRVFLREKDCEISVGIQNTNNLRKLEAAVNKAEQAMQQDKLAYYGRNGQERQLKGLNEKLERTLTQKRDAEHFLRVLAPKYRSVYVVNLQEDSARPIIIPDFFQKILDTSGGSFRAVITAYRDQYVVPESRDAFNSVLDYSFVRSKVLSGEIVEVHYTRTDGAPYTLKITPYSSSGSHIHETIWIFADDTATLTPPQRKLKNNRNSVKQQKSTVPAGTVLFCCFRFNLCPEVFRVLALGGLAGNGLHHQRLILAVGHAVPLVGAAQHLDLCLAFLDQFGDHQRQEILTLERVGRQICVQPCGKAVLCLVQEALAKAPQIHAHRGITRQVGPACAAVLGVVHAVCIGLDAGALGHAVQGAVRVGHAHAAGHAAVFRHRVAEQVAHHAVVVIAAVLVGGQVIVHHLERLGAVVVIGVDHRKGAVNEVLGGQHGVAGAPGLDPAFRHGVACGQFFQLLESVFHVHGLGHTVADGGLEGLLDLMLDDKDHGLEACAAGVVERIIHDDLSVGAHRVDLLHAAVTAAHTCRHHDQYRFVHNKFLLCFASTACAAGISRFYYTLFALPEQVQRGRRRPFCGAAHSFASVNFQNMQFILVKVLFLVLLSCILASLSASFTCQFPVLLVKKHFLIIKKEGYSHERSRHQAFPALLPPDAAGLDPHRQLHPACGGLCVQLAHLPQQHHAVHHGGRHQGPLRLGGAGRSGGHGVHRDRPAGHHLPHPGAGQLFRLPHPAGRRAVRADHPAPLRPQGAQQCGLCLPHGGLHRRRDLRGQPAAVLCHLHPRLAGLQRRVRAADEARQGTGRKERAAHPERDRLTFSYFSPINAAEAPVPVGTGASALL